MLVVVWVDAEAGHKAVDHQVHVSTLAPSAPGERLSGVEQKSLRVHTQTEVKNAKICVSAKLIQKRELMGKYHTLADLL